jgi:hypothetical protein
MRDKRFVANAILWASAIVASAIVGAPAVFTILLLPSLAGCALLVTWLKTPPVPCTSRS